MDHILAFGNEIIIKACIAQLELMENEILEAGDLGNKIM